MNLKSCSEFSKESAQGLSIIPLGGIGEFGMNLTIYYYRNRVIVVDAGIRFSDPRKLGVAASIPDLADFFSEFGTPFCYVLTHGHEDHIGALPHLLAEFPAPVYGTAWTMELINTKIFRLGMNKDNFSLITVEAGDTLKWEDLSIEFVHVTHSIPMSCALVIRCLEGTVFHSGDYKLDDYPVIEKPVDWFKFCEIGDQGIDIFLGDSTNSEVKGNCLGELKTLPSLVTSMAQVTGLTVLTTFSSNLWRIKLMIDAALANNRKVLIIGAGIDQTLTLGEKLNLYKVPDGVRISEDEFSRMPRSSIAIIASGSQGEYRSGLLRMALGEYKGIRLEKNDRVVFSSRVIPGNERQYIFLIDELRKQDVEVLTPRNDPLLHVSGHAHADDIAKLLKALKPKVYIPKHGGYTQLRKNASIAQFAGFSTHVGNSDLVCSGNVIQLRAHVAKTIGTLNTPIKYIESEGQKLISPEILRARLKIGEMGLILITGYYDDKNLVWLNEPELDIVGIELNKMECENIKEKCISRIKQIFKDASNQKRSINLEEVLETARVSIRRFFVELLSRKPIVMVKISCSRQSISTSKEGA